jgi:hypothetical protein
VRSSLAVAAQVSRAAGFDVAYVEPGADERREPLSACWNVRFESAPPVRSFPTYQGQRSFPGSWWSATTRDHVQFESWYDLIGATQFHYNFYDQVRRHVLPDYDSDRRFDPLSDRVAFLIANRNRYGDQADTRRPSWALGYTIPDETS